MVIIVSMVSVIVLIISGLMLVLFSMCWLVSMVFIELVKCRVLVVVWLELLLLLCGCCVVWCSCVVGFLFECCMCLLCRWCCGVSMILVVLFKLILYCFVSCCVKFWFFIVMLILWLFS